MPIPSQSINPSEKTPLIYPADASPNQEYEINSEDLSPDMIEEGAQNLDNLPDITENWSLINKIFYFAYYPMSIWFIMLNEALERFSFYGMR